MLIFTGFVVKGLIFMKKSTNIFYILLTALATILWFSGSWWHYSCNIKNSCDSNKTTLASSTTPENTTNKTVIIESNQVVDTDTDGLSDDEEKQLLDQALYQVRMQYVQVAQSGA